MGDVDGCEVIEYGFGILECRLRRGNGLGCRWVLPTVLGEWE